MTVDLLDDLFTVDITECDQPSSCTNSPQKHNSVCDESLSFLRHSRSHRYVVKTLLSLLSCHYHCYLCQKMSLKPVQLLLLLMMLKVRNWRRRYGKFHLCFSKAVGKLMKSLHIVYARISHAVKSRRSHY